MAILEIECPECGELLELDETEVAEFEAGDVLVCGSCETEMEVVKAGRDFELAVVDYGQFVECPNCGEDFEVTQAQLDTAPSIESADGLSVLLVDCPHCQARIELELEPEEEDGETA